MKLIIGGYSQGKLNYTLRKIGEKEYRICDGTLPEYTKSDTAEINIIKSDTTNTIIIINHLHTFIKTSMQRGENPKESILDFVTKYPDCILIVMRLEMELFRWMLLRENIVSRQAGS